MVSTLLVVGLLVKPSLVTPAAAWGAHGHAIAARAAVRTLPEEMPAFLRAAEDQLAYLNPEPDRWRDDEEAAADAAMNRAFVPDHFIHLDQVPGALFEAVDRFAFVRELEARGLEVEEIGLLPYRILELAQRLRSGFRRWRQEADPERRGWIEQRILNDAGILGHYVTDGANPHHTTMHYNGWVGENPRGYTAEEGFHGRFEAEYVRARITLDDLLAAPTPAPVVFASVRQATVAYLDASHARLERLYELDRDRPFGEDNDVPAHKAFAVERLAAGAAMLRDLWWTAWITSAPAATGDGR